MCFEYVLRCLLSQWTVLYDLAQSEQRRRSSLMTVDAFLMSLLFNDIEKTFDKVWQAGWSLVGWPGRRELLSNHSKMIEKDELSAFIGGHFFSHGSLDAIISSMNGSVCSILIELFVEMNFLRLAEHVSDSKKAFLYAKTNGLIQSQIRCSSCKSRMAGRDSAAHLKNSTISSRLVRSNTASQICILKGEIRSLSSILIRKVFLK